MTREQYEKLKELIIAQRELATARYIDYRVDEVEIIVERKEKELDKLMFPEGNGE